MAAVYRTAPVDPEKGLIFLEPGRYFVDTSTKNWNKAAPLIARRLPQSAFEDLLLDGRGHVIATFKVTEPTQISKSIYDFTGFWYLAESDQIADISQKLYGYTTRGKMNLWEWLVKNYPKDVQRAVKAGETVARAIPSPQTITKSVIVGLGVLAGLAILSKISK